MFCSSAAPASAPILESDDADYPRLATSLDTPDLPQPCPRFAADLPQTCHKLPEAGNQKREDARDIFDSCKHRACALGTRIWYRSAPTLWRGTKGPAPRYANAASRSQTATPSATAENPIREAERKHILLHIKHRRQVRHYQVVVFRRVGRSPHDDPNLLFGIRGYRVRV